LLEEEVKQGDPEVCARERIAVAIMCVTSDESWWDKVEWAQNLLYICAGSLEYDTRPLKMASVVVWHVGQQREDFALMLEQFEEEVGLGIIKAALKTRL
jgi:hypothetical protein